MAQIGRDAYRMMTTGFRWVHSESFVRLSVTRPSKEGPEAHAPTSILMLLHQQ